MENKDDILIKLKDENPEVVAQAIKYIKENGNLDTAIMLLDIVSQEGQATTVAINLLADIKDNNFRNILIDRLQKTSNSIEISNLLRISWESSLDYSSYMELFLDFVLNDKFSVAMEAATAIENMAHNLKESQKELLKNILSSPTLPEEKKFFAENILEELALT